MEKVKYNTFAVMFYINKGRIKKNGTTTIMGRISISGEITQFSTKIDIIPTSWGAKAYRLKGREREAIEINNKLQELTDTIALYHKDFIKQQGYVTAELLKNRVCNIGQKTDMLLELLKEHNEDYKQMIGVNREEKSFITYQLAINHIADFVKVQYCTEDIELIILSLRFLEDMMLFLRGEKGLSVSTANGIAISLKRVIKRAINQGTLRKDPFVGYKFDVVPPECRHQIDPAKNLISVNLSDVEYADFLKLYERSGVHSMAAFIKTRIFNETFRVVKVDGSLLEYTQQLSSLYNQYRAIGVNYNQTVATLKSKFEERKALAMLYKLEQQTMELVQISQPISSLSQEFRKLWLQKSALADHSQGR